MARRTNSNTRGVPPSGLGRTSSFRGETVPKKSRYRSFKYERGVIVDRDGNPRRILRNDISYVRTKWSGKEKFTAAVVIDGENYEGRGTTRKQAYRRLRNGLGLAGG